MKKAWIGFYDKNGKKIYEGDLVLAHRSYVKSDGYKRKQVPDKISVVYEVKWSNCEPKYDFVEIGPIDEHKPFDEEYNFRGCPFFESKPKSLFWTDKGGTMANSWHYDLIKHVQGEKKYKCLYEVERMNKEKK